MPLVMAAPEACPMWTTIQPAASPVTNGHEVEAIPAMLRPWACAERPMPTKRRTQARSSNQ